MQQEDDAKQCHVVDLFHVNVRQNMKRENQRNTQRRCVNTYLTDAVRFLPAVTFCD